jgi:folylpolyglutamate synthase/dihydropteroate synthase
LLLTFFVEHTQSIAVFAILAANDISKLLEALATNVESFSSVGLRGIVAEEDEGFQGSSRIELLMYAPQDVVEERLKSHMDVATARKLRILFATRSWVNCSRGSRFER